MLSVVPTIDLNNKCFAAFKSMMMWQRKLLAGIKLLLFLLTCALAIVSSFFSYNIRSAASLCDPNHFNLLKYVCSPVALAIALILCTALRSAFHFHHAWHAPSYSAVQHVLPLTPCPRVRPRSVARHADAAD